jgi:hypothetical protein
MDIRLMGRLEEIEQTISELRTLPGLRVLKVSNRRLNRNGDNVIVYIKVEVEVNENTKLDEDLGKKARSLQYLAYGDRSKIRTIVNAVNSYDWSVSIKDLEHNALLNAIELNLRVIPAVNRRDIALVEGEALPHQKQDLELISLVSQNATDNTGNLLGDPLLILLGGYGRGPYA